MPHRVWVCVDTANLEIIEMTQKRKIRQKKEDELKANFYLAINAWNEINTLNKIPLAAKM